MRVFDEGRICRSAVDEGLNPCLDGVTRALRFCTIESSIMPRDSLRKSALSGELQPGLGEDLRSEEKH